MKKKQLNPEAQQLNLFDQVEPPAKTAASRDTSMADMIATRNDLLAWGKQHAYPELQFAIGDGRLGDNRAGIIQAGMDAWTVGLTALTGRNADIDFVSAALAATKEQRQPAPATTILDAMRAYLLEWGGKHGYPGFSFPFYRNSPLTDRRFGQLHPGREQWIESIWAPQRIHSQREDYTGQWLEKCLEHVKRFDSGELEIPDWNARTLDTTEDEM